MRPLSPPDFTGIEPDQIMRAMQLCEAGKGDELLSQFENEFASLVGAKYAIAVSSATAGLHLSLLALGIAEGDKVICPTFTFAASAFPIMYRSATPVFIDSEFKTWNMSPEHLEEAIIDCQNKGENPKAIILVHSYGTPADLGPLLALATRYEIPVVEDAANALGSTWQGKQVGSFGQTGVFSFNRNKIISGAAGGCVVTNDPKLADKIRYYAHQAKTPAPYYQHEQVGYNYGISPILAEIIRAQIPFLNARVEKRRTVFSNYWSELGQSFLFQNELEGAFCNRWLAVFMSNGIDVAFPKSIQPRKVWKPLHLQPVFEKMPYYGRNESVAFFEKAIVLPFVQT